jgi:hypothetical protein
MHLQSRQFGHAFWGANFTTVAYNRKRFYNSYTRMAVKLFNCIANNITVKTNYDAKQ